MAGPCFHCGINSTLIWRVGPPDKPVLCNDCGLWWRINGTLEGYGSKRIMKNAQSSRVMKNAQRSRVTKNAQSSRTNLFPKLNPTNFGSSSGITISENSIQAKNTEATQASLWDSNNVSRKKRSTVEQHVASSTKRLFDIPMEDQSNNEKEDPESVLIFERINKYIPENEIGLGCMLLKQSPSPTKDSKAKN